MVLSTLMVKVNDSENTRNNNFAIASQYLKKKVRDGVHFLHANKYQSYYKLAIFFLMEMARPAQSTRNKKLGIFLQYIKRKLLQRILCCAVMQNI